MAQGSFTAGMKAAVKRQFGSKCAKCGATSRLQYDHHLPLCQGYALAYGNVVILCRPCNMLKSGMHPMLFYTPAELGRINAMLAQQRAWSK